MAIFVWRSLIAMFGIFGIVWAADVVLIYRAEDPLAGAEQAILSGDRFNAVQLSAMRRQLDVAPALPLQASTLSNAAIVRLLLLEDKLKENGRLSTTSDIADLQMAVSAALAQSPMNSFMWLTDLWLKRMRDESGKVDLDLLRMSYWSGPHESWIAIRRNALALGIFPSLPGDLAEQALSEFVGLVRSGLYADTANILTGPGSAIQEKLLSRLIQVPEAQRRGLAKELASRDLDIVVPGVIVRPFRPSDPVSLPRD